MGDPQRRSCEACESFGSVCKQLIRHNTCRRRSSASQLHGHRSANGKQLWAQTFKRGYVEQCFRRVCVRAELLHGEASQPFLQRKDNQLLKKGKASAQKAARSSEQLTVCEAMNAPWVYTKEASLAIFP